MPRCLWCEREIVEEKVNIPVHISVFEDYSIFEVGRGYKCKDCEKYFIYPTLNYTPGELLEELSLISEVLANELFKDKVPTVTMKIYIAQIVDDAKNYLKEQLKKEYSNNPDILDRYHKRKAIIEKVRNNEHKS